MTDVRTGDTRDSQAHRRAMLAGIGGLAAGAFLTGNRAAHAGPLNPPAGPITGTGKTLTEVEPRTAINAANTPGDSDSTFRIAEPGSYYLTGNVTGSNGRNGIKIESDNVTIDLNGFSLLGVGGSLNGIVIPSPRRHIAVHNGMIRGWGNDGVNGNVRFGRFERLTSTDNAAAGIDLVVGADCEFVSCITAENGARGIRCGSRSFLSGCISRNNAGRGIDANNASFVRGCTSSNNTSDGVWVSSNSFVVECVLQGNGNHGVRLSPGCAAINNTLTNNSAAGVFSFTFFVGGVRIEGNNCVGNAQGVSAPNPGNLIIRNSAYDNTTNYDIGSGNTAGPIVTSANIASNSNPHANYSY